MELKQAINRLDNTIKGTGKPNGAGNMKISGTTNEVHKKRIPRKLIKLSTFKVRVDGQYHLWSVCRYGRHCQHTIMGQIWTRKTNNSFEKVDTHNNSKKRVSGCLKHRIYHSRILKLLKQQHFTTRVSHTFNCNPLKYYQMTNSMMKDTLNSDTTFDLNKFWESIDSCGSSNKLQAITNIKTVTSSNTTNASIESDHDNLVGRDNVVAESNRVPSDPDNPILSEIHAICKKIADVYEIPKPAPGRSTQDKKVEKIKNVHLSEKSKNNSNKLIVAKKVPVKKSPREFQLHYISMHPEINWNLHLLKHAPGALPGFMNFYTFKTYTESNERQLRSNLHLKINMSSVFDGIPDLEHKYNLPDSRISFEYPTDEEYRYDCDKPIRNFASTYWPLNDTKTDKDNKEESRDLLLEAGISDGSAKAANDTLQRKYSTTFMGPLTVNLSDQTLFELNGYRPLTGETNATYNYNFNHNFDYDDNSSHSSDDKNKTTKKDSSSGVYIDGVFYANPCCSQSQLELPLNQWLQYLSDFHSQN